MGVYLRFEVVDEVYAISVANVLEVAALGQVVPVPRAPAEILGVRDLRGLILPVADLAAVLRLERSRPPSRLVVAAVGDLRAGFAVDKVTGVTELSEPTEESESPILLGAVLADGSLIGVIDVARAVERAATPAAQTAETDSMRAVSP